MARLHTVIDGCIKQIRQAVYAVTPAALDGMGRKWHAHNREAGPILKAGESVRLFDVACADEFKSPVVFGSTVNDYEQTIKIVICYGLNEDYNPLIAADYDAIMYSLHNINVGAVTGLNFYIVGDPTVETFEDARFLSIPVICRISADRS